MARKMIDCRQVPNEIGCTLTIAGGEEEVLDAAAAQVRCDTGAGQRGRYLSRPCARTRMRRGA